MQNMATTFSSKTITTLYPPPSTSTPNRAFLSLYTGFPIIYKTPISFSLTPIIQSIRDPPSLEFSLNYYIVLYNTSQSISLHKTMEAISNFSPDTSELREKMSTGAIVHPILLLLNLFLRKPLCSSTYTTTTVISSWK